jgi:hypothetical protein
MRWKPPENFRFQEFSAKFSGLFFLSSQPNLGFLIWINKNKTQTSP